MKTHLIQLLDDEYQPWGLLQTKESPDTIRRLFALYWQREDERDTDSFVEYLAKHSVTAERLYTEEITPHPEKVETTRVRFYVEQEEGSTILAVFFPGEEETGYYECYSHVGQHSRAHINYMKDCCRLARPEEYTALKEELLSIGYFLDIDPLNL